MARATPTGWAPWLIRPRRPGLLGGIDRPDQKRQQRQTDGEPDHPRQTRDAGRSMLLKPVHQPLPSTTGPVAWARWKSLGAVDIHRSIRVTKGRKAPGKSIYLNGLAPPNLNGHELIASTGSRRYSRPVRKKFVECVPATGAQPGRTSVREAGPKKYWDDRMFDFYTGSCTTPALCHGHDARPSLLGFSHRLCHRLFGILCRPFLPRCRDFSADQPGRGDRRHPYRPVSGLGGRGDGRRSWETGSPGGSAFTITTKSCISALFRRFESQIEKALHLFHHWGTWAIFIGRFMGPLRATVPLVAGMSELEFLALHGCQHRSRP